MPSAATAAPKPKSFFNRDVSGGMNLSTARHAIQDNEAWYMEGLQPISPGNLTVLKQPVATGTTIAETSEPTYSLSFSVAGTAYVFVVYSGSGNAYVGQPGGAFTKIFTSTLTSGQTCAAQWNKLGILIVDPTGYWDWGVTVAATLTSLDHSVQSVTITDGGSNFSVSPGVTFTGGGGSGAAATAYIGVTFVAIGSGGTGYTVGDILTLPGGGVVTTAPTVRVTAITGAGVVSAIQIVDSGLITGATLAATVNATGGAGTGCTISPVTSVVQITVTNRGSGYTSAPAVGFTGAAPARAATATANVSGALGGTAIAVYASRAWIASVRTVSFTDAGSYASFIGSGSDFTIDDSYLVANITALYAANNYLYIFGDDSIDVLSNVTVNNDGTASYSRVNVSPSIGCRRQQTIFAFYRSIAFSNANGFYLLTGASVESISENKLDTFVPTIAGSKTWGFQVTLNGQLCAAWAIHAADPLIPGNGLDITLLFVKGRWFASRQATGNSTFISMLGAVSVGTSSGFVAYCFYAPGVSNTQYQLFSTTSRQCWRLYTKLYELGKPITSKQVTRGGFAVTNFNSGSLGTGFSASIDTEYGVGAAITPMPAATSGYQAVIAGNTIGVPDNARFIGSGFSVSNTDSQVSRVEWFGFETMETHEWQ